jgi:glutathione peroxidase
MITILASALVASSLMGSHAVTVGVSPKEPNTIYDFTVKNIDGKDVPLSKFKGKVLLVVNVASKCGNTPQYAGLEKLYKEQHKNGFAILGFPANQFGGQEPGSDAEIKEFCSKTYDVNFPMFSKIVVKGDGEHPLYKWMIATGPRQEDIEWNFAKFLIGRDGKVIARFSPKTQPDSPEITDAIQKALADKG